MKKFNELGIQTTSTAFVGDKIKMNRVLNREIIVHDYKIEESVYQEKGNGKCLHLQIEIAGEKYVVFTGSKHLQNAITQVKRNDLPIETKIIKEANDSYSFT